MTTITRAAAVLVGVLLLGGCAATDASESAPETTKSATASPSAAPIELDENSAKAEKAATSSADQDATFLKEVRTRLKGMDGVPDAELIAAAHLACEQWPDAADFHDIDVIDGDAEGEPMPGWNDGVIAQWAAMVYCTEYAD